MNVILDDLLNPSWWISVVIAGFIVNLLSSYAKPSIDKVWSEFSSTKRKKLEEETAEFQKELKRLIDNPSQVYDLKLDVIYFNIRAAIHMLVILVGISASSFLLTALSQYSKVETLMAWAISILPLLLSFYSNYWAIKNFNFSQNRINLIRAFSLHKEETKETINNNGGSL